MASKTKKPTAVRKDGVVSADGVLGSQPTLEIMPENCPKCGEQWHEDSTQFGCWQCGYVVADDRN